MAPSGGGAPQLSCGLVHCGSDCRRSARGVRVRAAGRVGEGTGRCGRHPGVTQRARQPQHAVVARPVPGGDAMLQAVVGGASWPGRNRGWVARLLSAERTRPGPRGSGLPRRSAPRAVCEPWLSRGRRRHGPAVRGARRLVASESQAGRIDRCRCSADRRASRPVAARRRRAGSVSPPRPVCRRLCVSRRAGGSRPTEARSLSPCTRWSSSSGSASFFSRCGWREIEHRLSKAPTAPPRDQQAASVAATGRTRRRNGGSRRVVGPASAQTLRPQARQTTRIRPRSA